MFLPTIRKIPLQVYKITYNLPRRALSGIRRRSHGYLNKIFYGYHPFKIPLIGNQNTITLSQNSVPTNGAYYIDYIWFWFWFIELELLATYVQVHYNI